MPVELTKEDYDLILSCLDHARLAYESTNYPSNEQRKAQLDRLAAIQDKLRGIRDQHDFRK